MDFSKVLNSKLETTKISKFGNLPTDSMYEHILHSATTAGVESFGYRQGIKKKPPKLNANILAEIAARNNLEKELRVMENSEDHDENLLALKREELKLKRSSVKILLKENKLRKLGKIRSSLLKNDPTKKKFWKFVKTKMFAEANISAVYDSKGNPVYEQDQIEEAVLSKFTEIFQGTRTVVFKPGEKSNHDIVATGELSKAWDLDIKKVQKTKYALIYHPINTTH